jgi:hypothetical protein
VFEEAPGRSIDALVNAVAVALAAFTAPDCLNFFAAAVYDRVWSEPALAGSRMIRWDELGDLDPRMKCLR